MGTEETDTPVEETDTDDTIQHQFTVLSGKLQPSA